MIVVIIEVTQKNTFGAYISYLVVYRYSTQVQVGQSAQCNMYLKLLWSRVPNTFFR